MQIEELLGSENHESILFKLHFKRKKSFSAEEKKAILQYLANRYSVTNDVRYFNEFLWFYNESDDAQDLNEMCHAHFKKNLDAKGAHSFPLATKTQVREFLDQHKASENYDVNKDLKVGLVGFPLFFAGMIKELQRAGFKVEQVFIPFHPNKKIRKILSIGLLVKIASWLKKNFNSYDTFNYDPKDEALGSKLEAKRFDIGFHKLNFIIRENVYGNFKKGLINDHWGVLPFLRGKSTIAYTVLFGFPMVCTMHLIDKGIDMGRIVGFYETDCTGITSINGIRDRVRSTLTGRVVDAIKRLSGNNFRFIENEVPRGLTFYEIHPWLYKHAEETLKG